MTMPDISDETFEQEVVKSGIPVLVYFFAQWSAPCKTFSPILDDFSNEYSGKLKIARLNIDENHLTPIKFNIRGIPTLTLFKNGAVAEQNVGVMSTAQLTAFVEKVL
jgi:thioredoxin 1